MRIQLASPDFETGETLQQHVVRRVSAALAHFADRVSRVVVRFADDNGPRGGVDKSCCITLEAPHVAPVVVSAVSQDAYAAVDLAARRAARAARRAFERRWS